MDYPLTSPTLSPIAALAARWGCIFGGSLILWVAPISLKAPKLLIALSLPAAVSGFGWCAWSASHWRGLAANAQKQAILRDDVDNHYLALEESWQRQQAEIYYRTRAEGYGTESADWGPFTTSPNLPPVYIDAEPGSVQGSEPGSVQGSEPGSVQAEPTLYRWFSGSVQGSEPGSEPGSAYTRFNLNRADAIALIRQILLDGATQTEAIEYLWGCKKGGSKAYKQALAQYQDLMIS